jgi:hypothetical protein
VPWPLPVGISARDELHHLSLALRELVELLIDRLGKLPRKRVEDETGEPGREHRIALVYSLDRACEICRRDGLGDVAAGSRADHAITSSAASDTESARKLTSGFQGRTASMTARPSP